MIDGYLLIKAVFALLFVVALIGLLHFTLKKYHFSAKGQGRKDKRLSIIEQLNIDGKNRLVLVKCDEDEQLLIIGQNGNAKLSTNIQPAGVTHD